ncbi:hypothetical protein ACFSKW_28120 [Nonomuraea mangrovi]|uniref:Uncharacterized protein n=1 Tax=Nonomuraea mangrovi TaxID=2316207 RepID=A0ABW4T091_9ACTN
MAKSNPKISSARESRFQIVFGVHGQPMGGGRDIAVGVQVGEDGGRIHTSAAFAEACRKTGIVGSTATTFAVAIPGSDSAARSPTRTASSRHQLL